MCNVVLDVKAGAGHAFRYQGAGASIWSGEDWHVNDSGLMVAETSLSDGAAGNPRGVPLFVRVRRAIQYDASITGVVKTLRARYNGGYPGEWLIGDAKTGEIASLQLGRRVSDLRRTRRGFYDSSNWVTEPNLRREARAPQPSIKNGAYARYVRWGQLWALEHGRIDAEVARTMLADHRDVYPGRDAPGPRAICSHGEVDTAGKESGSAGGACDAKVVTSDMALGGMRFLARWGHPCGAAFDTDDFLSRHPGWRAGDDAFAVTGLLTFARGAPNPWTAVGPF